MEDDDRMTDDDVDSIMSPGTEETIVRTSVGGQSREQQHSNFSESRLNETGSNHENDLHDKGLLKDTISFNRDIFV